MTDLHEDIAKARQELTATVTAAVRKFQVDTGIQVAGIDVTHCFSQQMLEPGASIVTFDFKM